MGKKKVKWHEPALKIAIADASEGEISDCVEKTRFQANLASANFRTGLYHRDHKSPAVGNTPTRYLGDVQRFKGMPVGIVYTGNYSAMRDNHENNTLLKAMG